MCLASVGCAPHVALAELRPSPIAASPIAASPLAAYPTAVSPMPIVDAPPPRRPGAYQLIRQKLAVDDYLFTQERKKDNGKIYWVCADRECPAITCS